MTTTEPSEPSTGSPILLLEGYRPLISSQGRLSLEAGELAFLEGESGSGKSRLLRRLVELDPEPEGELHLAGRRSAEIPIQELRRRIGLLPQELPLHQERPIDLIGRICGLRANQGHCLDEERFGAWLDLFEVRPYIEREILLLSGGEKRRLALCLMLLTDPEVLLLDEPGAGLDPRRLSSLDELVQRCLGEGKAILWISHLDARARFPETRLYEVRRQAG